MARGGNSGANGRRNPGRGSSSGRGSNSSRALPPISEDNSRSRPSVGSSFSLCSIDVGNDALGCDRCDRWYHPSVLCMGIPETVIDNIKQYGGEGVSYVCTACRSGGPAGGDSQSGSAMEQLLRTVASLCETVQKLSDKVERCLNGNVSEAPNQPNLDQLSALISEECREMEERKKRLSSIIIRGVSARSSVTLSPLFDAISTELVGSPVQLSRVVCIDAEKGLFRARVEDAEVRRKLLDSAKNLKNSQQYSSVYINKDLTYKQRSSLIARRARNSDLNQNRPSAVDANIPLRGAVGGTGGDSGGRGLRSGSGSAVGSSVPLN